MRFPHQSFWLVIFGRLPDTGIITKKICCLLYTSIVMPYHILFDQYEEERLGGKSFGSTKSGIAPFYSDKYAKIGFQVNELFAEDRLKEKLASVCETKNVLLEHLYHKPLLNVDEIFAELMEYKKMVEPYVCDVSLYLNLSLIHIWDQEAPVLREKRKGDALVENRMYVNAIRVYQKLLKRENLDQAKQGLTMNIWHNLGCAYSYLFQMEKAMECFWEAFLTEGREEELICYLLAYRSVKKPEEYQKKLVELKVTEEVKEELKNRLDAFSKRKEAPVGVRKTDEILEKLTREYHRSTGS